MFLLTNESSTQTSCNNALTVSSDAEYVLTFPKGVSEVWLSYTPDSSHFILDLFTYNFSTQLITVSQKTGDCENLQLDSTVINVDSLQRIIFTTNENYESNLIVFTRTEVDKKDSISVMFFIDAAYNTLCTTSPTGCNMIANPGFEAYNPNAIGTQANFNYRTFQYRVVCDWEFAWGTPNIVPTGPWNPTLDHHTYLYAVHFTPYPNYCGEGIYQDIVGLIDQEKYQLVLDYKGCTQNTEPVVLGAAFTNDYTHVDIVGTCDGFPPSYQEYFDLTAGNGNLSPTSTFQPITFPAFTFDESQFSYDPITQNTRLTLYVEPGQNAAINSASAIVLDNVRLKHVDIDITVTPTQNCSMELTASSKGSYQSVSYSWAWPEPGGTVGTAINTNPITLSGILLTAPIDVTVTAVYDGCTTSLVETIPKHPNNTIDVTVDDIKLCLPDQSSADFNVTVTGGTPGYFYEWDPNLYLSSHLIEEPTVTPQAPGTYTYTLLVEDANNCFSSDQSTVYVTTVSASEPKIDGKRNICYELPVTLQYELISYDQNAIYEWELLLASGSPVDPQDVDFVGGNQGTAVSIEFKNMPFTNYIILKVIGQKDTDCETEAIYRIYDCCELDFVDTSFVDVELTQSMINSDQSFLLQGDIEINGTIDFSSKDIFMGAEATILIHPNSSLNVDATVIKAGCEAMWQGIDLTSSTSDIVIDNSVVTDAIIAISSHNKGQLSVENSLFEDNYIGICIKDHYISPPNDPIGPYPAIIKGTTFTVSNSRNLYYQPMTNIPVFCGIRAEMVNHLNIGDPSANSNSFIDMEYGIWSKNAMIEAKNNVFNDIYVTNPLPPGGSVPDMKGAISSFYTFDFLFQQANSHAPPQIGKALIAGGLSGESNCFTGCYTGIHTRNLRLEAKNNNFYNMVDCGIHAIDLQTYSIIESNDCNQMHTGIKLENSVLSSGSYEVLLNTLTNVSRGIHAINLGASAGTHLKIDQNYIRPELFNQSFQAGIVLESCHNAQVYCNNITLVPPLISSDRKEKVKGIWLSQTHHAKINNNNLSHLGSDVYTSGVVTNSRFFCNSHYGSHHGYFFGPNTLITDQGWKDIPNIADWNTHNSWSNINVTKVDQDLNSQNIVNPLNSLSWYAFDNQGDQFKPHVYYGNANTHFSDVFNNNATHSCHPTVTCLPSPAFLFNDTTLTPEERDILYSTLMEMTENYGQLNEEYHHYEAEYLYSVLFNDSILMYLGGSLDGEYQEFYDSLKSKPISDFVQVIELINLHMYDEAASLNLQIDPQTAIEEYRQEVNEIFLRTFCNDHYQLSSADSATLWDIALLTPYEGGYGVYTARVMLGIDPRDFDVAYRQPLTMSFDKKNIVKLFPNPAIKQVNVEFIEEIDMNNVIVEFYNIQGQLVLTYRLTEQYQIINLSALTPGMLFYRVLVTGKPIDSGKLILSK